MGKTLKMKQKISHDSVNVFFFNSYGNIVILWFSAQYNVENFSTGKWERRRNAEQVQDVQNKGVQRQKHTNSIMQALIGKLLFMRQISKMKTQFDQAFKVTH